MATFGKVAGILRRHRRVARPVIMAGDDLLRLGRVEEAQIGLGDRGGAVPLAHCRRRSATGGSARIESDGATISNLPAPSSRWARKASFSQASSTSPMPRSAKVVVEPRAPVSSTGTLAIEAGDEVARRRLASRRASPVAPGGEEVPARAAAGLGVGRDDLDAGPDEVAPVADPLRIALADEEDDRRGIRRAVVRAAAPASRRAACPAVSGDRIDVVGRAPGSRRRHRRRHEHRISENSRAGALAFAFAFVFKLRHSFKLAHPRDAV